MSDYVSTVNHMLELLSHGDAADAGRMEELAHEYAFHLTEAQRRLKLCCDCLAQGQTEQAFRMAEAKPLLLTVIEALNFNGIEHWNALAERAGLAAAPAFDEEQIRAFKSLYDGKEALQPLLKAYQVMVIRYGSARDKIRHLRRIKALDPGTPDWAQDLKALDRVRALEIAEILKKQGEQLSEVQLASLVREMTHPELSVAPDRTLLEKARRRLAEFKTKRVQVSLDQFGALLNEAYGARDFEKVSSLLTTVETISRNEGVGFPERWRDGIQEARAWRDEEVAKRQREEEHQRAVNELRDALASDSEPAELQNLLARMDQAGQVPPQELRAQAEENIARHAALVRRQRLLKRAGIAAAALVVIGAGIWLTATVMDYARRRSFAAEIRDLTKNNAFNQVEKKIEEAKALLPGAESDGGSINKAIDAYRAARSEDEARLSKRAGDIETVRKNMLARNAPGMLEELRQSALGKEEEQAARQLADEVNAAREQDRKNAENKFDELRKTIAAKFTAANASVDAAQVNEFVNDIGSALKKEEDLQDKVPPKSASHIKVERNDWRDLQRRADELSAKDKAARLRSSIAREALAAARQRTGGDLEAYVRQLELRSEEFKSVLAEYREVQTWKPLLPAYLVVVDWGKFIQKQTPIRAGAPFSDSATCATFRAHVRANRSDAEVPSPYAALLKKQLARAEFFADAPARMAGLEKVLNDRKMKDLRQFTVSDKSGFKSIFYTDETAQIKQRAEGASKTIAVYTDTRMKTVEKTFTDEDVGTIVEPPHNKLCREVEALMTAKKDGEWFSNLPKAVRLVNESKDSDASVRALLLHKLFGIDAGSAEAGGLHTLSEDQTSKTAELCEKLVPFWVPTDEVRGRLRKIDEQLSTLRPAIEGVVKTAEQTAARERMELAAFYRPLVWSATLGIDDAGNKTLVPVDGVALPAEYWTVEKVGAEFVFKVVAALDADSKIKWVDGENVRAGQPLLSPVDGKSALEVQRELGADKISDPRPLPVNLDKIKK